jgi:hypothetical protein
VVKILGHSQLPVQTGIEHYNSYSELPPFGEILSMAKKAEMSAITFTIATVTIFGFLILNPTHIYRNL